MKRNRQAFTPGLEAIEPRLLLSVLAEGTPGAIATGLYRQVFLRDPAPPELARLERQLDAGRPARQVADTLYASPQFRREQVVSYYDELLDRAPTPDELRRWTGVLMAGAGEGRVVAGIAGTTEYFARSGGEAEAYVRSLYVDVLGREADPAGLATFATRLRSGTDPARVAEAFTSGAEFRELKIREAYRVVLARDPEAGELARWASAWGRRGGLRGVAADLLGGRENLARVGQPGGVPLPDLAAAAELKRILRAPYSEASTGFVALFNSVLATRPARDADGDPIPSPPGNLALWNLLRDGGATDGRPADEARTVSAGLADVAALIPLQSEVDLDKSLRFVLSQDPAKSDLEAYLAGGSIRPFGGPILTGGGGTYIVDGHHRWSSLYVINPYTRIDAIDLGHEATPQDYLKVAQAAIGAVLGFLPVQTVEGRNLFTIARPDFNAWVAETIRGGQDPEAVLEVFRKARGLDGVEAVADYLWANVERMRQLNRPAPGVTSRDFMPQPPGDILPLLHLLESGRLNYRTPTIARLG